MFCSVGEIRVTEERVIWQLKLRHVLYLGFAGIFLALGINGGIFFFVIGVPLAVLSLIAALYPNEALSFEAVACGAFNYFIFRKKEKKVVTFSPDVRGRVRRCESTPRDIQVEVAPEEFENEEEVAGEVAKVVIEAKRKDLKKI